LAELLRKAEAKTRVQELTELAQVAVTQLRAAEERIQEVEERSVDIRPTRQKELDQAILDEDVLRDLIRRTAQNRGLLGGEELHEAEHLIQVSRDEIVRRRHEAQGELDQINRELESARRELRAALDRYDQVRREIDRLQVVVDVELIDEDHLAQIAETYFPEYQIRAFAREVDESAGAFGMMDRREQYAQMKIWIGRLRRFQSGEPLEDEREILEGVFRRLVTLSKQYEPGYIEAFNRQYAADWDAYIVEATEALRMASEDARRPRSAMVAPADPEGEPVVASRPLARESRATGRRAAETSLERLRLIAQTEYDDEDEKVDIFREALRQTLDNYGPIDSKLIEVVRPYRSWLAGRDFTTLRRQIDQQPVDED
jgi:hypothetical protein